MPQDAFRDDPDGVADETTDAPVLPLTPKRQPRAPRQKARTTKPRRPAQPRVAPDPGPPPPLPPDLAAAPAPSYPDDLVIPPKPPLPPAPAREQPAAPVEDVLPDAAPAAPALIDLVPVPEPVVAEPEPEPVVAEPERIVVELEPEAVIAEAEPEAAPAVPEQVVETEPEPVVVAEPEPDPEISSEIEPESDVAAAVAAVAAASGDVLVAESPVAPEDADPFAASVVLDEELAAAPAALALRGVSKRFGDTRAVDGIDLTIPAGTFYGLVGPNGAGKTTTLSLIAGLLRPDKGSITVAGVDAASDPTRAKRLMGVLPDRLRTFDRLTGRQLLYYYGVLRGLPSSTVESRIADLARAFDLTDALGRTVSDYSAGMTKKVMLAGALIHSPRLLVLDEPFEAVDPVSSAVILDILSAYVAHGGTVILSSHGMDLVERVCTRVAVMVSGQVLAEGTVDDVRGELTLEQRFVELAGGLGDVEGLEWLHTFSD
ncbi:ABC transporter ATP-binding protein [Microbacterium sp. SS28]|uniref:ABC transporter ATP-binding protein n=1 Tax=Microbacterium sp. SS28 TaxID=2919948 RepID=UPI001FAB004F|nr:ABC transporter ATP-binding protein [Microbacterium sp. SS28]